MATIMGAMVTVVTLVTVSAYCYGCGHEPSRGIQASNASNARPFVAFICNDVFTRISQIWRWSMERAEEIFERINNQGVEAIEVFITDRKSEELFLDFKRSRNNGSDVRLADDDRKNLSKAISGFGNSEGGVIVWGIDGSRDYDGADVARAIVKLENPARFASLIQNAISGCTVPPHTGVRVEPIEMGNGQGVVVVLVPKSNAAPHQSVSEKHYYIRAGSSFVPTPHDVLAGMFGRRPQSHVFHNFILGVPELVGSAMKISFGIAVHNEGPGIASDIFAICRGESLPGDNCEFSIEIPDQKNWTGGWEFERQLSLISAQGYRLPPGATAQPIVVHLSIAPPFSEDLGLFVRVGAGTSRRYDSYLKQDASAVESQYRIFNTMSLTGAFSKTEKHRIAEGVLGLKPPGL
ncbi:AlbA family DNA-binding domain-containing protein [Ferrovum myxofaciens]|uniref:AlbA family DNA-binding domain-containing protein n=1 Tax=Ferrovum myxofaciens TaxID=416213 RepID=UPI00235437C5|nr:ATP-binding protein [Ferrovum myxofaciens]MBU6995866.1 ATP-binding protein [Ferrovum myxofaciens]